MKMHLQRWVMPSPAHENLGATLLPPPDSIVFARGKCCPKIQKKAKEERRFLNLISFEVEALEGKLMLITCLFYAFWIALRLKWSSLTSS
jgi:hypothetical protein